MKQEGEKKEIDGRIPRNSELGGKQDRGRKWRQKLREDEMHRLLASTVEICSGSREREVGQRPLGTDTKYQSRTIKS